MGYIVSGWLGIWTNLSWRIQRWRGTSIKEGAKVVVDPVYFGTSRGQPGTILYTDHVRRWPWGSWGTRRSLIFAIAPASLLTGDWTLRAYPDKTNLSIQLR